MSLTSQLRFQLNEDSTFYEIFIEPEPMAPLMPLRLAVILAGAMVSSSQLP